MSANKDIEKALRELEKIRDIFFSFAKIAGDQDQETVNFTTDQLETLGAAIGGAVIVLEDELGELSEE